jgi:hypothetical protein
MKRNVTARRQVAAVFPFASAFIAIVAMCCDGSAETLFRPDLSGITSKREILVDPVAFVFDEVRIPLVGPPLDLMDDGTVQTFRIDLAPLSILLLSGIDYYDFTLFVPNVSFPLPGSSSSTTQFWSPDALDSVQAEGMDIGTPEAGGLQEYRRSFGPDDHRTVVLGFFSRGLSSLVTTAPGEYGTLTGLNFVLDIPTQMVNSPTVRLEDAVLRIEAQHWQVDPLLAESLPFAVLVVPEPATLVLSLGALVAGSLIMIRRREKRQT